MKGEATNGGKNAIEIAAPYSINVDVVGNADILFHRWNCEAVAEKAAAKKGSAAKKTDDIESYVYRNDAGELSLPGENFRQAMILAAKFVQDPRSPRKSACDLYKAGIVSTTPLASFGTNTWDYEHAARVVIQRSGITRIRPALKAGWKLSLSFMVLLPEYISAEAFIDVLTNAGKLCGVGDFRPTYGRFQLKNWEIVK